MPPKPVTKPVATKSKPGKKENQPTAKEKQYQDEIVNLNREIRILRSNLDPKKIEEELKKANPVSEWNLEAQLQQQVRMLEYTLKKYESSSGISSDEKQQKDAQCLAKENTKDTVEKRPLKSEVPDEQLQLKLDALQKEFEEKLKGKDAKISSLEKNLKELTDTRAKEIEQNRALKSVEPEKELQKNYDGIQKELQQKENQVKMLVNQNVKIEGLEEEISQLRKELESSKKELSQQTQNAAVNASKTSEEDSKKELEKLKSSIKERDDAIKERKTEIEELNRNLDMEKQKFQKLEKGLQEKLKEKEDAVKRKDELIGTLQSSTEAGDSKNEKIQKAKIVELEQMLEQLKRNNEKLNLEKEDLEKDYKKLSLEMETLEKSNNENMRKITNTENKMKTIIEEHKKKSKAENKQLQKGKAANEKARGASSNADTKGLRDKHEKTVKELNDAKEEISELKNRLSKVVGANIMDNNPNITDLSDENRPTKLSEKFSELYDNEWTDAYEEAENELQNEQDTIKHLYNKLLNIFDFCQKTSNEYAETLKSCALKFPSAANGRPNSAQMGVTNMRQLKELRKSFSPHLVENVFQHYVKSKKLDFKKKPNTEKFIKGCVRICWLMSSQDPPVIFDTANVKGAFDGDKFRTYTKTGKNVDYVVWPPMLLHQNGPVLCKGVAQGK